MIQIAVPALETPVVSSSALRAAATAMSAAHRLGPWPASATLEEYVSAVDRACREAAHVYRLGCRYHRRHWTPDGQLSALPRLTVRREVTHAIAEQRQEVLRLLIGPPEGAA